MRNGMKVLGLVLALTAAFAWSSLSAAVLVEDDFAAGGSSPSASQYQSSPATTDGSDNNSVDGQSPARTGFGAGAWAVNSTPFSNLTVVVDPAGLTYTDSNSLPLLTTPGHLRSINGFGKHGVTRSASRAMTLSGPLTDHTPAATGLYIAMLLRVNETILDTFDDIKDDLRGPHVEFPYGTDDIRFGIQKNQAGDGVEAYAIHERNPGSVDRAAAGVTEAVSAGQTVLIVSHHFTDPDDGDSFELWINPEDLTDESVGKDYSGTKAGDRGYVASNSAWGLEEMVFNPGGQSASGGVFEVDEVRIGTSWGDVVPYVPEPATMLILSAGGAFVAARRRRK